MITRPLHHVVTLLLAMAIITPKLAQATDPVFVRGYVRPSSGAYVAPHFRSAPDGNFYNNWSTKGNINPFTGAAGTRVTPPLSYGGNGVYGSDGVAIRTTGATPLSYGGYVGYEGYGTGHGLSVSISPQQRIAGDAGEDRQLMAKELYKTAAMDTLALRWRRTLNAQNGLDSRPGRRCWSGTEGHFCSARS